jgi:hypothetical protein
MGRRDGEEAARMGEREVTMVSVPPTYDVFLSYNWRDQAAAEAIARTLRDQGLRVFLDRWYLVPGRPWPETVEAAVGDCGAVAVLLGPNGVV